MERPHIHPGIRVGSKPQATPEQQVEMQRLFKELGPRWSEIGRRVRLDPETVRYHLVPSRRKVVLAAGRESQRKLSKEEKARRAREWRRKNREAHRAYMRAYMREYKRQGR